MILFSNFQIPKHVPLVKENRPLISSVLNLFTVSVALLNKPSIYQSKESNSESLGWLELKCDCLLHVILLEQKKVS